MLTLKEIEEMELKYLNKYYYFLKFAEDEMFFWFRTKEKIKDDWWWLYWIKEDWRSISDFAVWAERIVYSLLNWKWIWQPNSCPVGADLFFEVEDAFIHIDLKTVQQDNIWDIIWTIFVWINQNSYKWVIEKRWWNNEYYNPSLPTYYLRWKEWEKICLSYFMTILYDKENLDILLIAINCMPNWELEKYYWSRPLSAGKNPWKARFNFKEVNKFELLEWQPSRVKVVYFNKNMKEEYRRKLKFYENILN